MSITTKLIYRSIFVLNKLVIETAKNIPNCTALTKFDKLRNSLVKNLFLKIIE
jgi:hypothetical protein